MKGETVPEVDMRIVAQSAEIHRQGILGFAPRIGLGIVDYSELDRIDNFYMESQKYRDYYRDPHNIMHKPDVFQRHQGKCGIKMDVTVQNLTEPIRWVEERRPVVYPLSKDTSMRIGIPIPPMIRGRYSKSSSTSFLH
ncbi:uncharacterized protein LOC108106175 [Drosophila eugracilis]|uniref:uncharacterized protein LOC108106175 n=1 Tax=Drosophila eugracilis TaxID=29029 RepID=UPI0007E64DCC|nr:uncharacterized protein LOC108106175 [Drosophila eugracilis]